MGAELLLDNVGRHISLNEEETAYLLSLIEFKNVERKQYLLKPGNHCHHTYFITKGCMRIYQCDSNGFEHIAMFGIEDWWISDLPAFLTQTPATHYLEALEPTEVIQIEKSDLEKLYLRVPKFERYFRILHQNAFVAQHQRIMQNISMTAEERYLFILKKYPALEQRISQKHMAAFLGITPVFLSMLRRKLAGK